jgi:hypothetical protein
MSYLTSIVEPSGTITVGQTVTYSFSFSGPYPVYWSFDALGHTESDIAMGGNTITISIVVPSNPNLAPGLITFWNQTQYPQSVYRLKPLDGFTEVVYPALSYLSSYQDPTVVTNNTAKILSVFAVPEVSGFPITTASYPLVLSITSQQVYPTLGTETTVFTHTFNTPADYSVQTYTTPNVVAGTVNRYKAYATISGGSPFSADTRDTRASVSLLSSTNAPIITLQPSSLSLPHDVLGTMYNAGAIGIRYMSPSSPTIAWFRNGVQIPLGGNTYPSVVDPTLLPNYGGFDSSISLVIPNAWPGLVSSCANGDSYHCTITNANGTTTSNTVTLTISALASSEAVTAQISPSTPVVMPEGGALSLNAASTANKPTTYQWKKDGTPIPGATASTYSVVNAPSSASGAYSVVATSGTAVYETPSTQVTVKQLAYSVPNVQLGYAETDSTITWQAIATTEGMPGDTFTYSWQFDDGEVKIGNPVTKLGDTVSMYGTVTAIDNVTGGTATASRGIQLFKVGWTQRAAMPSIDPTSLSVTLNSGKVLLVNRNDGSSYLYDPVLDSWSSTGNLGTTNNGLIGHKQLVLLPSGKALLTGLGAVPHKTTKIYDPSLGAWGDGPDMIADSSGGSASYVALNLYDGRVFVYYYGYGYIAQIYSETLNTWTRLADPPFHSPNTPPYMITQLDSDRIMVMGDYGGDNQVHLVIYKISSNSWATTTTPPSFGYSSEKADLVNPGDGFIYCMGYGNGSNTTRYSAKYSIVGGSWTALAGYTSSANSSPMNRFLLSSGSKILIVDTTYSITYDISSNTYSPPIVDYMGISVSPKGGVVLPDGRPFTMTPNSTSCQTFDGAF